MLLGLAADVGLLSGLGLGDASPPGLMSGLLSSPLGLGVASSPLGLGDSLSLGVGSSLGLGLGSSFGFSDTAGVSSVSDELPPEPHVFLPAQTPSVT